METMLQIEKVLPGKITYYFYKDKGLTNRLEVTLYPNAETEEGEGILIHSKAKTKRYPHDDFVSFINTILEALGEKK